MKIEEVKCNFEVLELEDLEGFTLNKKSANVKVTIYDSKLIQKLITAKFNQKYERLLYLINELNTDDTTDSDIELALLKIDDLRKALINKYYRFLNSNLLKKYLNMLLLLEEKVPIRKHNRGR